MSLVYELINEVKQAARLAKSSGNQQIVLSLKEFAQMLSENVQVLNKHPDCTVQEAANFPDSSAPAKAAQVGNHVTHKRALCSISDIDTGRFPSPYFR